MSSAAGTCEMQKEKKELTESRITKEDLEAQGWKKTDTFGLSSTIFKKGNQLLLWDRNTKRVWLKYQT